MASSSSTWSTSSITEDNFSGTVKKVSCISIRTQPTITVNVEQLKAPIVGQEMLCSCVSVEDWAGDWYTQPISGWKSRRVMSSTSSHFIALQSSILNSSMENNLQVNKLSSSSISRTNSSMSKALSNLGSESKSSIRSYMQFTPDIPYTFHHYEDGDICDYIKDYRNMYTYPNIEERVKKSTRGCLNHGNAYTVMPRLLSLGNSVQHRVSISPVSCWKREDYSNSDKYSKSAPFKKKRVCKSLLTSKSCRGGKDQKIEVTVKGLRPTEKIPDTGQSDCFKYKQLSHTENKDDPSLPNREEKISLDTAAPVYTVECSNASNPAPSPPTYLSSTGKGIMHIKPRVPKTITQVQPQLSMSVLHVKPQHPNVVFNRNYLKKTLANNVGAKSFLGTSCNRVSKPLLIVNQIAESSQMSSPTATARYTMTDQKDYPFRMIRNNKGASYQPSSKPKH